MPGTHILRRFGALLLALCFTTAWSLNSLHDLLLHHEHPVCEAAYDGKSAHIHDERYEAHSCSLCALLMAAPELPSAYLLPAFDAPLPDAAPACFYHAPARFGAERDLTLRRGPPALG